MNINKTMNEIRKKLCDNLFEKKNESLKMKQHNNTKENDVRKKILQR